MGTGATFLAMPRVIIESHHCTYVGYSNCTVDCSEGRLGCGNEEHAKLVFEYTDYRTQEKKEGSLPYKDSAGFCCAHTCCEGVLEPGEQLTCDLNEEGELEDWHEHHAQTVWGGVLVALSIVFLIISIGCAACGIRFDD
jgi:hypothetical protein